MSNYNDMKLLIATYSGNERHITIPKIYLELTNDYPTAALLNQMIFWSDKTKRRDGFFYKTYKEWEEETFLSEYQVRRASKKLKELGFLETKLKKANGSPTLHYKLDMDALSESIVKKLKNRNQRNLSIDSEVPKESLTEDDTVNDNSIKDSPAKAEPHIPFKEIIEHLNHKTNSNYRHTTKATQQIIKARFNEGFTLNDFIKVIDTKTVEWINDNNMAKYLRPQTLFGTKFESYLNQSTVQPKQLGHTADAPTEPSQVKYDDDELEYANALIEQGTKQFKSLNAEEQKQLNAWRQRNAMPLLEMG